METAFENLLRKIKEYNPNADTLLLSKAFELAQKAHQRQQRNSGEPYIMHPLGVALILADMEMDIVTIIAGMLHDVIEDTECSYEQIKEEFGENIAELVDGVTKLEKIQFVTKEEQQVENLRKMFLAMAKDIRVIIIKLADRLHNMRTLKSMPVEKQLEKSRETLEVYAPLAHRLGIYKIKMELEDLALRYLDSVAYYEIVEGVKKRRAEREAYIEVIKENIVKKLAELNIEAHIEGRAKHFYSIYKKMFSQNKTIDEIYDLFAVRVIVNTVSDCYAVLGMVHEQYKPIPGRFKDYIAMPKPNMYQSLHTTVIGPEGYPFEVQIRTWEMHRVAEHGVAAHWKYKEGKSGAMDIDKKLEWVRQLLEIQKDATDTEDFMQVLKIDLFADEVFVFTPKGDVINLPNGATVIDFAFAIHSAVGYKMFGAKVNSKITPLDYQLKNGDIVEILTSSSVHGPSQDWLKIVKTSQAKNKINQWFKKEKREENIVKGRELLEKELKRNLIPQSALTKPEFMEFLSKRYSIGSLEDIYAAIGYNNSLVGKIIPKLKEITKEQREVVPTQVQEQKSRKASDVGVIVKDIDNCLLRLSRCCNPVPGDEIIGFITRGRGVSVHRKDCPNIQAMADDMYDRLIECWWSESHSKKYICELQIDSVDRQGILSDITSALTEMKFNIMFLNARTTKEKIAVTTVSIEVLDTSQLETLIKQIYRIPGVLEVRR